MNERPLSVTIISWLFLVAGAVGVAYHAAEFRLDRPFDYETIWVCLVRLLAILGGVFMLRGRNWARQLMVAWMAYHIALSALHAWSDLLIHTVLFSLLFLFLHRPAASCYFLKRP